MCYGTEFACHLARHDLAVATFFCDPHAPWKKGGIENAISRIRRFIPRKTDLTTSQPTAFANALPLHRYPVAYVEVPASETGQPVADPIRLIVPMLERFIATELRQSAAAV